MSKGVQAFRCKGTKRAPGSLELVDASDEPENFRGDGQCGGEHTHKYTQSYPISKRNSSVRLSFVAFSCTVYVFATFLLRRLLRHSMGKKAPDFGALGECSKNDGFCDTYMNA